MKLTSKFVEYAGKWGNLYRFRYYINGWRVSADEWERARRSAGPMKSTVERVRNGPDYRTTWVG